MMLTVLQRPMYPPGSRLLCVAHIHDSLGDFPGISCTGHSVGKSVSGMRVCGGSVFQETPKALSPGGEMYGGLFFIHDIVHFFVRNNK